ncbi:MAG: acyl carrier protein [Anaerolineales bacterium]|jgi:acyl carrier protein
MADTMLNQVATFIAKDILKQPDRVLAPDEPLISSGLIDSFHLVDLALFVEETFGTTIDDTELNVETFDTLKQLCDMIRERL